MVTPTVAATAAGAATVEQPRRVGLMDSPLRRRVWPLRCLETVVSGPAGTGKSLCLLLYLHTLALEYPGLRALVVRRTRESLTESALVTYEALWPGAGGPPGDISRRMRHSYVYPHGSEIVVGGMDKPGRIMSTEFDVIYVMECIEVEESAWEMLTTRLRHGRMGFHRILGDTNPDRPDHWIMQREAAKRLTLVHSTHEDNPSYFRDGVYTVEGKRYLAALEGSLSGHRLDRLRYGRWVQASGVIYESWEPTRNLIDRRELPIEWERWLAVDFGYTAPFVCSMWAKDGDGRIYLEREVYRTKRLVSDHAEVIATKLLGWRRDGTGRWERGIIPAGIVCDPEDAEGRATLTRVLGLATIAADKRDKRGGIQDTEMRMRPAGDGKPRLMIMRDALVEERDPELVAAHRPTCTAEEIPGYVWKDSKVKEEPVDRDAHGCDSLRYLVAELDVRRRGQAAIAQVQIAPQEGNRWYRESPRGWQR